MCREHDISSAGDGILQTDPSMVYMSQVRRGKKS